MFNRLPLGVPLVEISPTGRVLIPVPAATTVAVLYAGPWEAQQLCMWLSVWSAQGKPVAACAQGLSGVN